MKWDNVQKICRPDELDRELSAYGAQGFELVTVILLEYASPVYRIFLKRQVTE